MTLFSDQQLLELNSQGLVPGPSETESSFSKRAAYCLTLKQHLSAELKSSLAGEESDNPAIIEPALAYMKGMYDAAPGWIPVFFSDYRLPFWHGGCAWIFQTSEETPTGALIQLRQKFRFSNTYLGIYSRDELISHEMTHVARMEFKEPKYEEVLAYKTSQSAFRRLLGPIVESSTESVIFILVLFIIIVFDVFLVAMQRVDAYMIALWLKAIPVAMIGYGLFRMYKKQRTLDRCLEKLEKCSGSKAKAQAIALRLTDREIVEFSNLTPEGIIGYAEDAVHELRWRVINNCYLPPKGAQSAFGVR